jgi:MFS transporter, DHA1 family, tetracycline resistance protein
MSDKLRAAAPFILVTVFLDMLSIGVIIPVLPRLIEDFVGSISSAGLWTGIFGSCWGLAQFIFSPIQGGLSDSVGRRPVVLFSNFGTGVDFLFMALAPGLWWLLVGRIISGMTSASISTAYAYMSDVTPPEKRAGIFGMMGAAFGIGFVVGPSLGGVLGEFGHHVPFLVEHGWEDRLPFFFAAVLSLLNFIYGWFVLPESLAKDKRKPFSMRTSNPLGAFQFLAKSGQVLRLSVMYLMMMFAQSVFPTTTVLYCAYRFGWGPFEVGLMLAVVGVCSAIVQAGLTGVIVKKIGERKAMYLGLFCGLLAFIGYGLAPSWEWFVATIPLGSMWGLATPNIQALMSSKVDPKEQGTLQGANMSLSAMATIFAPILFGSTLSAVTHSEVPKWLSGSAFWLAALFMVFSLLLATGVKQSLKVEHGPNGGAAH